MSTPSITVCMTSFNRFDLVSVSLDTFFTLNKTPVEKVIVIEDSVNLAMKDQLLSKYQDRISLIYNDPHIGQIPSIDKMYAEVKSDYILHTEDDFLFQSNPNFIKDAVDVLEENLFVHQVWLKHISDFRSTHGQIFLDTTFEPTILHTSTNVPYQLLKPVICGNWHGFSFITHLKRTKDYRHMFPQGYQAQVPNGAIGSPAEAELDVYVGKHHNYRAAILVNTVGIDTGRNRYG